MDLVEPLQPPAEVEVDSIFREFLARIVLLLVVLMFSQTMFLWVAARCSSVPEDAQGIEGLFMSIGQACACQRFANTDSSNHDIMPLAYHHWLVLSSLQCWRNIYFMAALRSIQLVHVGWSERALLSLWDAQRGRHVQEVHRNSVASLRLGTSGYGTGEKICACHAYRFGLS